MDKSAAGAPSLCPGPRVAAVGPAPGAGRAAGSLLCPHPAQTKCAGRCALPRCDPHDSLCASKSLEPAAITIVHWSGHGHLNLLEIRQDDGSRDLLSSGDDLVQLFREAGGFIPQLVFLSACLSGTMVPVDNRQTLLQVVQGENERKTDTEDPNVTREMNEVMENQSGYTDTALTLLRTGVPQVVAMRYEVGDE